MENMFEKGCLVQLSISVWKATKKIDPNLLSGLVNSCDWLSATKKLIDPESLKPISKAGNAARTYLRSVSLPFPIQGMVFVPKEMISRVDGKLEEIKDGFCSTVDVFARDYGLLREAAVSHLGSLFNELEYPVDVRQKFSFVWRFVILDVPNGNAGILSPEVYEREKEKFINTMEEARELAILSLRGEFASMVARICERFTNSGDGKPKVFKNATINSFYEYFETFKERNIFRDDELTGLVSRAQHILGGTSAEAIRDDTTLRETISSGMQEVEEAMANVLSMPRRKIIMD